jgi:hypothetical protein
MGNQKHGYKIVFTNEEMLRLEKKLSPNDLNGRGE